MIHIDARPVGFFALLTTVLRHIKYAKDRNQKIWVYWNKTNCLYYEPSMGDNSWEYFFEPIKESETEPITQVLNNYIEIEAYPGLNIRQTFNHLYNTYVKVNVETQKIIDASINSAGIDENTLGVHIRKTDRYMSEFYKDTLSLPTDDDKVFPLIDSKMKDYKKLFLATDCVNTYALYKERYKDVIIDNDDIMRGADSFAVHTHHSGDGYRKGIDVILDSYRLSKCGYLVLSTSNVSCMSMFMNLSLRCININEIFRNDTRIHEFNIYSDPI